MILSYLEKTKWKQTDQQQQVLFPSVNQGVGQSVQTEPPIAVPSPVSPSAASNHVFALTSAPTTKANILASTDYGD